MSKQMKEGVFKIAHNTQPWWGFTLQRGHAYGLYRGVCYVSAAEPSETEKGKIVVYKQSRTKDFYRWSRQTIHRESELGHLIVDAICASPYDGVTFREDRKEFDIFVCDGETGKVVPAKTCLDHWAPGYQTMSQSRRGHYDPRPLMPKRATTWVDQICQEAMA